MAAMRGLVAFGVGAVLFCALPMAGQELEPAAYKVVPINVNLFQAGYILAVGDVNFAPALPVEDAEATINTMTVMYGRTLSLFGRSANFGVVAPYSVGHLEGIYIGEFTEVDRSGLRDPLFRLAVNLYGGPAMELKEFASYKPKTNVGASIRILAPLGEYDSSKLINLGTNRWSFKPEIGVTRALGKWSLECYAGVWFFTDNTDFFGGKTREQDPIGSFQMAHAPHFQTRNVARARPQLLQRWNDQGRWLGESGSAAELPRWPDVHAAAESSELAEVRL